MTAEKRLQSTPGPWRYSGQSGTFFRVEAPPPADRDWTADHVCNAFNEADARLIAAAPELLEQLQAFVAFIDPEGARTAQVGGPYTDRLIAAREAIAKALGQTEAASR